MERASNSKRIMEVESELRSRMAIKGQSKFAREAGWAESKVTVGSCIMKGFKAY
ncbi:CII family transcriptional regulator [Yersinia enterocolitica]